MPSTRTLATVGVALLIVGGVLGATGYVETQTPSCESGSGLSIDRLDAGADAPSGYEATAFENLTPTGQRVFLEAYTDDSGLSRLYESAAPDAASGRVVAYRGERYVTNAIVSDCVTPLGDVAAFGGAALSLVGLLLALAAGVRAWRP
ncbi:hypothetical protein GCM10009037_04910 [Halarchaeum grantii]|uniref:DUF7979 domain-containing protein n=1 Tax=Halarchaeum grantii TaxID=1193105 RepID=A0A830F6M9_9EURY|nr:hypothetical protein [Halarchaeum grantii]GGL24428.1 hypothetical protein GCM10009037_04910 [Halarchaeum grantii]